MLFSYYWLQSFFEKKLPEPKVLADLIIRHSFEVEGMEKKGKDTIFDISILSNRPDCFSHIGIAREIGAILGRKLILPKAKAAKMKNAVAAKTLVDVKIENPEACRRYTAKMVSGVKIGPSPKWMRERLEACGMRSINNVVDATNYVMLETGQPLHAFDWDKLAECRFKNKSQKNYRAFREKRRNNRCVEREKIRIGPEDCWLSAMKPDRWRSRASKAASARKFRKKLP